MGWMPPESRVEGSSFGSLRADDAIPGAVDRPLRDQPLFMSATTGSAEIRLTVVLPAARWPGMTPQRQLLASSMSGA